MKRGFSNYTHVMTSRYQRLIEKDSYNRYPKYYDFITKNLSDAAPFSHLVRRDALCPCCKVGIHFVKINNYDKRKFIDNGVEARHIITLADYTKQFGEIHFEVVYSKLEEDENKKSIDDFIHEVSNNIMRSYRKLYIWVFEERILGVMEL